MNSAGRSSIHALFAFLILFGFGGCASIEQFSQLPDQSGHGLLLIIHGSGSSAEAWPLEMEEAIVETYGRTPDWDIRRLEWNNISEHRMTGAPRGRELGRAIGERLARDYDYRIIHLVGHSLASHVMYGLTSRYRELEPAGRVIIHQTYLDPFVPRGVFLWSWGEARFGEAADFAESFVTTDDPAFMTNAFLEQAYNIDLSATIQPVEDPETDSAHYWPVHFYIQDIRSRGPFFSRSPYLRPQLLRLQDDAERLYSQLRSQFPVGEVGSPRQ